MNSNEKEKGAALVTTLFLVAVMSAIAVSLLEDVTRDRLRTGGIADRGQALWYARGAEELAKVSVQDVLRLTEGRISIETPGLNETFVFPVEGGVITAELRDATNCFNLNTLVVTTDSGRFDVDMESVARFRLLLAAEGFSEFETEQLADALVDWMDSDTIPRAQGAEDGYYSSLSGSEVTTGQPLSSLGELALIRGFEDLMVREPLSRLLCVRVVGKDSVLNVNTLPEAEASLLVASTNGALDEVSARSVLRQRPLGGWSSLDEMFGLSEFATILPEKRGADGLAVVSTHFEMKGSVTYRMSLVPFFFVLETGSGNVAEVTERRVGSY